MQVTILKKRWRIRFAKLRNNWGDCDPPTEKGKLIRLSTEHPSEKELLDTLIHECLHCALPEHKEDFIGGLATDLTRILIRMGWRLGDD